MTDLPVLFLDVDGVIAPYGRGQTGVTYRTVYAAGLRATVIPAVIGAIHTLSRSGLCDIRWLTSWQESAAIDLAPELGLDHFYAYNTAADLDSPDAVDEWKEQVVTSWANDNDGTFVWIDDELVNTGAGTRLERTHPGRGLYLSPDRNFGLSVADVERLTDHLTVTP